MPNTMSVRKGQGQLTWGQRVNPKEGVKTDHMVAHQIEMVQRRSERWVTERCHEQGQIQRGEDSVSKPPPSLENHKWL